MGNCGRCGSELVKHRCAACRAAQAKARHLANPEKQKEASRRYYLKHREECKARSRAWAAAHPEETRAYTKKHEANPERKAKKQAWDRERHASDPVRYRNYQKQWRLRHPERAKSRAERHRIKRHGLTREEYDALIAAQQGRCAICGTTEPERGTWSIDHDHGCCSSDYSCGLCVRGLLCVKCNFMIGLANDDIEILRRAIAYVANGSVRRLRVVGGVSSR